MNSKSPETVQSKVTSLSSADIARTKTTNTTVSTLVEITYTDNNRKAPLTKIRRCPETVQLVRELLTAKDILVVGPECEGTFSIQIPEPKNVKSIREKFSRFMIKKRSRSKDWESSVDSFSSLLEKRKPLSLSEFENYKVWLAQNPLLIAKLETE